MNRNSFSRLSTVRKVRLNKPQNLSPKHSQFTIKFLLVSTFVVAIWFAGYGYWPAWAILLALPVLTTLAGVALKDSRSVFYLPLATTVGWIGVQFVPWWTSPHERILIGIMGLICLASIAEFSIRRTTFSYQRNATRSGVIFLGLANSMLAGLIIGLMLGIPLAIYYGYESYFGAVSQFGWSFERQAAIASLFLVPAGAVVGLIAGIPIGFVCDILVGLNFKNRKTTRNHGTTNKNRVP